MAKIETYRARGGRQIAEDFGAAATAAGAPTPFTIEVRFLGGLTDTQKAAFRLAADRWTKAIVGDLPSVTVDGEVIDDIVILAQGSDIDGPGKILGQAGPTALRPSTAGASAFLPAKGQMMFDSADLADMEQRGTLNDVITHEMGHVLGIGTIVWNRKKLLKGAGTKNPTFTGKNAEAEYGKLLGGKAKPVPVENTGGQGTADSHWRETVFGNELMTGFVADPPNPMSRMTIASLKDLGYEVNLDAAEAYQLPDLHALAAAGAFGVEAAPATGIVLPSIPVDLPPDSLQI